MITVTILSGNHDPVEEGIPLHLVSGEGKILGSAKTDSAGVATFDIDAANAGQVAIRLDIESLDTMDQRS